MKKSERMMDILGGVSSEYIVEAAEGLVKKEKRHSLSSQGGSYTSVRRLTALIAAMVAIAVMSFALGLSVSAQSVEEPGKEYQTGTLLTDLPVMMMAQDYEELCETMRYNLADVENGDNIYNRCTAFYVKQSIDSAKNDAVKQAMIKMHPITQITDVYTLEQDTTPTEENAILYWLMYYGEMNQEKLVAMYQRLYDAVEASDFSKEEKQHIRNTLPEIPLVTTDLQIGTLTNAAAKNDKTLPSPGSLPIIMTAVDYEAMIGRVLEDAGVESIGDAPHYAQRLAAFYIKYDLGDDASNEWEEALAPLLEVTPVYVLDYDVTLWERSWLCSAMALYADIWLEDSIEITNNLHDAIDASNAENKDELHDMAMQVWEILRAVSDRVTQEQSAQ